MTVILRIYDPQQDKTNKSIHNGSETLVSSSDQGCIHIPIRFTVSLNPEGNYYFSHATTAKNRKLR
jgi:hypothetical protein